MRNKCLIMIIVLLTVLSFNRLVSAAIIVDTGSPQNPIAFIDLNADQWLAAKFIVNSPGYYITDIEGYFDTQSNVDLTGGNITIEIRGDGDVPPPSSIYSGTFTMDDEDLGFRGVHNISAQLSHTLDNSYLFVY